ncbi:MAG: hypothetical protein OHK0052_25400 [Anaerolineales bacterium]
MKRLGCLTPMGIITALLTLLFVGGYTLLRGGVLFSPGDLNAQSSGATLGGVNSHAAADCAACHPNPWTATSMDDRCLACHAQIATDLHDPQAMHAILYSGSILACRDCHPEHRGANAPLTDLTLEHFPHQLVGFSLDAHQTFANGRPIVCQDCHPQSTSRFDAAECATCHAQIDTAFMQQHTANFGEDCRACHDGVDRFSGFDHTQTLFPLLGEHAGAACADCHRSARQPKDFAAAPSECYACHQADDIHNGEFGTTCEACHAPDSWKNAIFDHAKTNFPLEGLHTKIECKACHAAGYAGTARECSACHLQDDAHQGRFGTACETCHTANGWKPAFFDHALSAFPLTGAHQSVACEQCHINNVFSGTPQQCAACHADPAFHLGVFGTTCETCHTTDAWQPARFEQPHTFPMNHGESGWNACKTCHTQNVSTYTCYTCHEHNQAEVERKHRKEGIANFTDCMRCHPTGREKEGGD